MINDDIKITISDGSGHVFTKGDGSELTTVSTPYVTVRIQIQDHAVECSTDILVEDYANNGITNEMLTTIGNTINNGFRVCMINNSLEKFKPDTN